MANSQLIQGSVASLLGLQSEAVESDAAARAQGLTAAGYGLEAEAYERAAAIADYNAGIEGIAGEIRLLQEERELNRSLGATRAATAAAGFKESGSTIDLLRSSMQDNYLAQALTRTQTALDQAGYIEQAVASRSQRDAASLAQKSALNTQQAQTEAGSLSRVYAANQTAALTKYLSVAGGDEEAALVTGVLAGTDVGGTLDKISRGGTPQKTEPLRGAGSAMSRRSPVAQYR